ncbi:hypothetical protein ACJ5H2_13750 [Nocardioides sp. R1-1]|uniref:hypothetical protein n=1 Tax=Nocardioides sp. R1-1 TaxID=3383502 RepID=UPI0038CFF6A7
MDGYDVRLADRFRARGVLAPDDAARLLLPVADSLASVHAASGLHSAVSPSAIQVDDAGRAVLLARTEVEPDPSYAPPDLTAGRRPLQADDVWSLAAVLLQVTTGHPPANHGIPLAVPRSTGWLAPIIELGLRADPRERPSAAEVADYLRARVEPAPPRRRPRVPVAALAGAAVIAVLAVLGATLLFAGGDEGTPRRPDATGSTPPPPPAPGTTAATPSAAPERPTAAQLERFARDYVATASGDPERGIRWLTADYRQRSPRYREVWASIRAPRILSVAADPAAMTVRYTYRYELAGGGTRTEDITLFLVQDGGRLLIADATSD